jgi:hypothetical protein
MPEVSLPGGGQDGEQPPPAVPARDETPAMPDDDWDPEAEQARYIADLDAGRRRIPGEWEIQSRPPVTISLGDAADVDPAELAAMLGPDGLGGEVFAPDRPADALRPGPLLAALTERAAGDPARLGDNELLGAVAAARRLAARGEHLELRAVAEFTRRQDARYAAAVEESAARRRDSLPVPPSTSRIPAGSAVVSYLHQGRLTGTGLSLDQRSPSSGRKVSAR